MGYFFLRAWLLPAATGLLFASCQPKTSAGAATLAAAGVPTEAVSTDMASVAAPADGITAGLLKQHTQMLASDVFEGRRPFTAGEEKATRYL